jgi:two-component system cell cycle response regulator DivK
MFAPTSLPLAFSIPPKRFTQFSRSSHDAQRQTPVVLVVDDDADSLILISYVLEQFKCALFCETDGQSALALAHQLKPDLIVLDILLPGLSGLEVVQALRKDRSTRSIPVIAVTAMASSWDQEKALRAGCSQYLSKPYLIEDMQRLLSCYLMPNP